MAEVLQEVGVVAIHDLPRRDSFFLCPHGGGGAVGVGAGDHQHVVAHQAVIAGEDVGRQVSPRHVAQMTVARGVGPGDADEYSLWIGGGHVRKPLSVSQVHPFWLSFSP